MEIGEEKGDNIWSEDLLMAFRSLSASRNLVNHVVSIIQLPQIASGSLVIDHSEGPIPTPTIEGCCGQRELQLPNKDSSR